MILSRGYRFIFLKTAKSAGTSLEIALSRFLSDGDIITPISAEDERIRQSLGYRGPQNYRVAPGRRGCRALLRRLVPFGCADFYNHMPGCEVRRLLRGDNAKPGSDQLWNSCFKFCVERNPFDRVISLYYWCCRTEPRMPLSDFLQSPQIDLLTRHGIDVYTDADGKLLVDQVLRYETLEDDLTLLCQRLGLPEPLNLPRAKSGHRTDRRHYSELLTERDRTMIEDRFHRELKLWDYQFQ